MSSTVTSMVILSCAKGPLGRNNYAAWLAYVVDSIGTRFGNIAKVMKTHVAYVVPPILEEDYNPNDLPAGMVLTEANRREIYIKLRSRRQDALDELADEAPKFFRALWATLGEDSRNLVAAQPNYDGAAGFGSNERPNELWAAIRLTHFTNENSCEGPAMARMNLLKKQEVFDRFRQLPGVSIAVYKRDFLEHVASLEAAGMTADHDAVKALKFLNKLDQVRHGPMMVHLQNEAGAGRDYPQTVEAAYTRASTWTSHTVSGFAEGTGAAVYLLSDEIKPKPRGPPKPPAAAVETPKAKPAGKGPAARSRDGGGRPPRFRESEEAKAARIAYHKLRECNKCGELGHIGRDCPNRAAHVTIDDSPSDWRA
jgi:hypothetical protein